MRKLCKAYSSLTSDEWDDLPATTNAVESINRQSIPANVKAVSLKPLIEHIYLKDRRQAILQLASNANVTISYHVKQRRRSRRPAKALEKSSSLRAIPSGKQAIGTHLSAEFYTDDRQQATTWYKGTVISYNRQQGYVITFDGFGPEENESIKCLRKAFEKKEIRLL